jgi:predicted PurR-regulated permease PerM
VHTQEGSVRIVWGLAVLLLALAALVAALALFLPAVGETVAQLVKPAARWFTLNHLIEKLPHLLPWRKP